MISEVLIIIILSILLLSELVLIIIPILPMRKLRLRERCIDTINQDFWDVFIFLVYFYIMNLNFIMPFNPTKSHL